MHDTVFIHSGLGNQKFEYAFYLSRKRINPHTTCNMGLLKDRKVHNGFELNKIFNINIKSAPLQTFLVRACNYSRIFKTLARFLFLSSSSLPKASGTMEKVLETPSSQICAYGILATELREASAP